MKLYPITEHGHQYHDHSHVVVTVNGSKTCVPVGVNAKHGDYLAVINYEEMMTLLRKNIPLEIEVQP